MGFIQFETERLLIRDHFISDVNDYFSIFSDKQNIAYVPFIETKTVKDAEKDVLFAISEIDKPDREHYFFKACLKEDLTHVGQAGFSVTKRTPLGVIVEAGYFFKCEHWHKGYASEALKALMSFCFLNLSVIRFEASCLLINDASKAVIEKAGLTREGTLRAVSYRNGVMCDRAVYSMLRDEFCP